MSTVLVTGATDGLGRALATRLASEGATVIAHARSEERGREALAELLDGFGEVQLVTGDLASLSAVRALADQVPDRLDVLVNNAGIGFAGGREESADGYELRFAVNYLAGFLLASLLRERLTASAPARIVNVASAGQQPIDFDDVMLEDGYDGAARVPPEQARAGHARLRPRRGARAPGRHRHGAAPRRPTWRRRWSPRPGSRPRAPSRRASRPPGASSPTRRSTASAASTSTGRSEARADAQAYDLDARRRLRELSQRLVTVGRS